MRRVAELIVSSLVALFNRFTAYGSIQRQLSCRPKPSNPPNFSLTPRKAMATPSPDQPSVEQSIAIVQATTFDIFNEHDQLKRRQLMEKYWAPDVTCYSPFGEATGYDALDQVWGGECLVFSCLAAAWPLFHDSYATCTLYTLGQFPTAIADQRNLGLHTDGKSAWLFQRSGDLWLNFGVIMQPWVFGRVGEQPGMKGWDVIIVGDDGKVKKLYAMIEGISTHPHPV
ncbi:uncharacterized protein PAC_06426 [Phialocephala subalpina]|uniref:SnoaL-like domain-containing protein n=1 Tax=Phialocephala subalpina TaxID=576137 RepID=A0A1L7WUT5_9HELO|nr:uncharacterized protein PAC_06426 [Phialocephala subalpina]